MAATYTMPERKFTWLITGCSSGFGLSLLRIALAAGHTVIGTSRNPKPDLVAEIGGHGGRLVQLDIDSRQSGNFIDILERSGTRIDVLVNNAGFCSFAPIETATEAEVRSQMETMYFGPMRLIQAVVPYMRKRRFGVIVNFSSGASLDGNPTMGPYAAAKAGLDAATRVLAKEVANFNIRTLTVILGTFNTSFGHDWSRPEIALPEDYKGTMSEEMLEYIANNTVPINGDKDKAMKAVYEVVVGGGDAGTGRLAEKILPLGTDMTIRVKTVQDYLAHALEAFKQVTDYVKIDN